MTAFGSLFEQASVRGARITLGVPATEEDVAAIIARAGTELASDYVQFLREMGAVRIETELPGMSGDVRFLGHAPGDPRLDVVLAIGALPAEYERWSQPVQASVPVLVHGVAAGSDGDPGSECMVMRSGAIHHFRRGELERRGSFTALVEDELAELCDELDLLEERRETERALFSQIRALVPLEVESASGLVVRRPSDGVSIELTLASWRETYRTNDGLVLVASWSDATLASDEARNAFVRDARIARAKDAQCTAQIHVAGLEPARFLAALASDAHLPVELEPSHPDLDTIATMLVQSPPKSAEQRLLEAMLGRGRSSTPSTEPTAEPPFVREGDVLVGKSTRGMSRRTAIDVQIRVGRTGLVEVTHTRAWEGTREAALSVAARAMSADDGVHAWVGEGAITFGFVTSDAVLGTEAFTKLLTALEEAVTR